MITSYIKKYVMRTAVFTVFCLLAACCRPAGASPVESYNRGAFMAAVKEYKRMADNGDVAASLNLAIMLQELGDHGRAILVLRKAAASYPDNGQVYMALGRMYYLAGQPRKAVTVLLYAQRYDPDALDTLATLGLCYAQIGDDAKAQQYLQKVIALNRNDIVARLSLADLYYRKHRLEDSAQEYKAISIIDASFQRIYKYWADIVYQIGNYKEAYKLYQKLSFQEPDNKHVRDRLTELSALLGQEYFAGEKKKRAQAKERKLVFVKPSPADKNMTAVSIGLVQNAASVEFKVSVPFELRTKNKNILLSVGRENESYSVRFEAGKLIVADEHKENIVAHEPVVIRMLDTKGAVTLFDVRFGKNTFWSDKQDRSYRGDMEFILRDKGILVVNKVSMEAYLYSVVPSEMPAHWPVEALKAQAVAARSEAIAKLGRHKADGFDFCPEVHCQVYAGVEKETEITNLAVDETRGVVLYYKNKPVDAIYSSCCGGHTQDNIFSSAVETCWRGVYDGMEGGGLQFPLSPLGLEYWLKEPPKGLFCDVPEFAKASNFRWVRVYTAQEINDLVRALADIGDVRKIVAVRRERSGHISELRIVGTKASLGIERELKIRTILGNLRSSMFKIEIKRDAGGVPEQFIFYGGGWGHGVGMCQAGACGMALRAKSYRDILQHYYKDIEVRKIY